MKAPSWFCRAPKTLALSASRHPLFHVIRACPGEPDTHFGVVAPKHRPWMLDCPAKPVALAARLFRSRGETARVRPTGILAKRNTPKKARKFKHIEPPSGKARKSAARFG
jgi:hypothetical protein